MKKIVALMLFLAAGAGSAWAEAVPASSARWVFEGRGEHRVEMHQGREAIFLNNKGANIADANFDTGVIEFDMMTDGARGFPGLVFRGQGPGDHENFYIRPHQSGNPDANQYTPVFNDVAAWQILYGPAWSAPTRYRYNEWMHIKVEVAADSARIYIDSETPSLVVHDLLRDRAAGFLALTDGGTGNGTYYANFSFFPGPQPDAPPPAAIEVPPNLVRSFAVSAPMTPADANAAARANRLDALTWNAVGVEANGIANPARVASPAGETDTVLTRISLNAARARSVRLRFGFSDRVRVYLNGVLMFDGGDGYTSRDYRFLGTVGFYDALYLPLRRGRNEIVLAVSEDFGGWAAAAALENMDGLTLVEAR